MAGNVKYIPPFLTDPSQIAAGIITADKITVTELSALSANMGTITAGTLAAGTVFAGTLSAASGTFGTITAGDISGVTISGSIITGGTVQTATTGQKIRMVASTATLPNQNPNSLMLVNSDGNSILSFGSTTNQIMVITPINNDQSALLIQNDPTLVSTQVMLSVNVQGGTSSAISALFENAGTGNTISASSSGSGDVINAIATGTGQVAEFIQNGGNTVAVTITQNKAATGLVINQNDTSQTIGISITTQGTGSALYATNVNSGNGQGIAQLYNQVGGTNPVLYLNQAAVTQTHFYMLIFFKTPSYSPTLWVSDGTTPNGNLTGSLGDLCLGGPLGSTWQCSGGTTWVQL